MNINRHICKELRIGNYYLSTDATQKSVKVTSQDLSAWSEGAIYGKLIALTGSTIKRFGFTKTSENTFTNHSRMSLYFDKERFDGFLVIWDDKTVRQIRFVHELQNFWFVFTNQEIDEN